VQGWIEIERQERNEERLRKKKVWADSSTKSKKNQRKISADKVMFEVLMEEKIKEAENVRNEIGGPKEYKKMIRGS
jgi:hypothetical protein